ncbi:MAG: CRISPR-associated endonuclease Cas2 [Chloroflexota bacterium]|nr:CRISPR-associated endonuclease Cas2 [Chloroflexota bacterium]
MFVVISYDIPDNKRRLKIAKTLQDFGGERVQLSVFECYTTPRNLERLQQRLQRILSEEQDSVRFYTLCETCRGKTLYLGRAKPIDEPGLRII